MAELADVGDLKSPAHYGRMGSTPILAIQGVGQLGLGHPAWNREVAGSNPAILTAGVAQLEECSLCKRVVVGSSPTSS